MNYELVNLLLALMLITLLILGLIHKSYEDNLCKAQGYDGMTYEGLTKLCYVYEDGYRKEYLYEKSEGGTHDK